MTGKEECVGVERKCGGRQGVAIGIVPKVEGDARSVPTRRLFGDVMIRQQQLGRYHESDAGPSQYFIDCGIKNESMLKYQYEAIENSEQR
ncbi:MAG: hypothetical protein CV088_11580 [Nitrospira sp. LK70]|nr:hypothetical protein [Nitrospira sp. LK70]